MRQGQRLTETERADLHQRIEGGETYARAAAAVGCSTKTIQRWLGSAGVTKVRRTPRALLRLSLAEREEISRGVRAAESCRTIARRMGRAPSTVAREIQGHGGRRYYRAWRADAHAVRDAQRPKVSKLARCRPLRQEVECRLALRWSPQQIAARLAVDYPDEPSMRVSHETIYRSLGCSRHNPPFSDTARSRLHPTLRGAARHHQRHRDLSCPHVSLPRSRSVGLGLHQGAVVQDRAAVVSRQRRWGMPHRPDDRVWL
jgi:IS30 family transposase